MNSRAYRKPLICKVDLRPEEAVLTSCKLRGDIVEGAFGGSCWYNQVTDKAISCLATGS